MNGGNRLGSLRRGIWTILRLGLAAAPRRTVALLSAQLVAVVLGLISTYSVKYVAQAALAGDARHAVEAAAILAVTGGMAIAAYLVNNTIAYQVGEAISVHIDSELIRLTALIPTLEHQDQPEHADKMELIRAERGLLATSMQSIVLNLRSLLMLVGVLWILIAVDPRFALLPLFAVPRAFLGERAKRAIKTAQETTTGDARLRAQLFIKTASASAGKELRVFGLDPEIVRRIRVLTANLRKIRERAIWQEALWLSLGDLIFMVAFVAAIGLIMVRAERYEASIGDVIMVATMATMLVSIMSNTLLWAAFLVTTVLTVERYNWLVDLAGEAVLREAGSSILPEKLRSGISIEGLSFGYPGSPAPVLTNVSLEFPVGQVIALVGENGSGKSSLVKVLCGFYRPSLGRVCADDVDLANVRADDWRRRVSAAFQDYTNFEVLLRESVGLGDLADHAGDGRIVASMRLAGAEGLVKLKPSGMDSMLGKRWGGVELSGGQWQKVALSRAFVRNRPLLAVFDEPTAALDPQAEYNMFRCVAEEARGERGKGRVTLIVSHRFSTVRMADVIVVLSKGHVAEVGDHKTLMSQGGLYAELFELQSRAYR